MRRIALAAGDLLAACALGAGGTGELTLRGNGGAGTSFQVPSIKIGSLDLGHTLTFFIVASLIIGLAALFRWAFGRRPGLENDRIGVEPDTRKRKKRR